MEIVAVAGAIGDRGPAPSVRAAPEPAPQAVGLASLDDLGRAEQEARGGRLVYVASVGHMALELSRSLAALEALAPHRTLFRTSQPPTTAAEKAQREEYATVQPPPQVAAALAEMREVGLRSLVPSVVVTTVMTASSSIKRVQQGQ